MSSRNIACGIFCFVGFFIGTSQLDTETKLALVGICGIIAVALCQPTERKG